MSEVEGLRAALSNADQALQSMNEQIDTLKARIEQYRDRAEQRRAQLLEAEHKISESAGQIQEVRQRLAQAHMAASLAAGGDAEASQAANVSRLQSLLAYREQQHEAAQTRYSELETASSQELGDGEASNAADESELAALSQQRHSLEQTYKQVFDAVGQALYDEMASALKDLEDQKLEQLFKLDATNDEIKKLKESVRKSIPTTLSPWSHLQARAGFLLEPGPKVRSEESETVRLLTAAVAYGDVLVSVKGPIPAHMAKLLSFDEQYVRMLTKIGPSGYVSPDQAWKGIRDNLLRWLHDEQQSNTWQRRSG